MDFKKLSHDEIAALERFLLQSQEVEKAQALELIEYCNNKYQFAKTYSVYIEDWEKTKGKMLEAIRTNKLPPGTSKEFMENMIEISEGVIKQKLDILRPAFQKKFGESIDSFLAPDGKRRKIFGLF